MVEITNQLRKSDPNTTHIAGYLNSKKLEIKTNKNGDEYIKGVLSVQVDEKTVVPVEIFSNRFTKDRSENKVFKGLVTVDKEYKDSTQVESWDKAEKVRIANGQIQTNEWYKDDQIHSRTFFSTNFINRVEDDSFKPQATFKIMVIINKIRPEIKQDEETGRGFVDCWYIDFKGKLMPVTFVAEGKTWNGFKKKFEDNDHETLVIWGDVISTVEKTKIIIEADIGEDRTEVVKRTIKERLVRGVDIQEGSFAYDIKKIKEALVVKQEEYEELKSRALFDRNDNDDLPF